MTETGTAVLSRKVVVVVMVEMAMEMAETEMEMAVTAPEATVTVLSMSVAVMGAMSHRIKATMATALLPILRWRWDTEK
jgi:hypothetical protein